MYLLVIYVYVGHEHQDFLDRAAQAVDVNMMETQLDYWDQEGANTAAVAAVPPAAAKKVQQWTNRQAEKA